jgi:hypothetical protein
MEGNWRPIAEIIPTEIPKGHGAATSPAVLLTNGTDVWVGYAQLIPRGRGHYISWGVHGATGYDWEPEFHNATHYMPLPPPYKDK